MKRTPHDQPPWRTYRRDTSVIFGQQEMSQIPKPSRANASQVKDFGIAEDRSEEIGGYTFSFVSILAGHDLGPILAGLPGGHCSCPHWGYVVKGELTVRYGDREEVIGAGERSTCHLDTCQQRPQAASSCSSAPLTSCRRSRRR